MRLHGLSKDLLVNSSGREGKEQHAATAAKKPLVAKGGKCLSPVVCLYVASTAVLLLVVSIMISGCPGHPSGRDTRRCGLELHASLLVSGVSNPPKQVPRLLPKSLLQKPSSGTFGMGLTLKLELGKGHLAAKAEPSRHGHMRPTSNATKA